MTRKVVQPEPFSEERPELFRPFRVDPRGEAGPTRWAARGLSYRRTSRGYYVPVTVDGLNPEQRIVEAAAVLPDFGGVTGWAGLRWRGGRWFDGRRPDGGLRPVVLATGYDDVLNQQGILISQERIGLGEISEHDGLRVTEPVRSLFYEMRYAGDLFAAVQCADMAAYDDLVSVEELTTYVLAHPGWTGVPQCRQALPFCDENSWSPAETRCRLCWVIVAELPPALTNRPVFDRDGRHLGTPDLLDEEAGVAVEYDGVVHLDPERRRNDVGREERYRRAGIEVLSIVAGLSRAEIADRMTAARSRARFAAPSLRPWTIDPPSWWTPTTTVASRRSLPDDLRARVLGYRDLAG